MRWEEGNEALNTNLNAIGRELENIFVDEWLLGAFLFVLFLLGRHCDNLR